MPRRARLAFTFIAALGLTVGAAADPPRKDAHGDLLPAGATARLGSARVPTAIATVLPPDFTAYSAAGPDGRFLRRGLADGKVLGPTGTGTVVSADGSRVVEAHTGELTVREVATGKAVAPVRTPAAGGISITFGYPSVALSGDGKRLAQAKAGGGKGGIEVYTWDVEKNEKLAVVTAVQTQAVTPAFSADGSTLATWGMNGYVPPAPGADPKARGPDPNRIVQVWDAATGKELAKVEAPGLRPAAVALSADGALLAVGSGDGRVELRDARTGAVKVTLLGRTGQGARVAFGPDGKTVAAVAGDGAVQRWKTDGTWLDTTECPVPPGPLSVAGVGFAGPDRVVAWGAAGSVGVAWDAPAGKLLTPLGEHHAAVHGIAFAADGKEVVTSAPDGRVVRWDPATGRPRGTVEVRRNRLNPYPVRAALVLGPGGRAGLARFPLAVFDTSTGAEEFALPPDRQNRGMTGVYPSPDATRVAVAYSAAPFKTTAYAVWDLANRRKLVEVEAPGGGGFGSRAAFSPDNARLVT
ncbi:MAG TPA: hypothetical protein VH092_02670, partial [Urbifossiella sp.]|nr:hypothetical protein [Urbifossiella sp.]